MTHPAVIQMARILRIDPTPAYTAEIVDGDLVTFDVSDSWLDYYGGTREQWTGIHPLTRFAPEPEQAPEWYGALSTAMAGGSFVFPFVVVPRHDGVTHHMSGKLLPILDDDGSPVGVFSQATLLDERLAALEGEVARLQEAHCG